MSSNSLVMNTMLPLTAPTDIRRSVMVGASVIVLAFGGFGTWAALAPLDSAVVAKGQLTVESTRKTIQHLEGGIVKDILVKDGDAVVPGQVLLRLDDTKARATFDLIQGQYDAALAELCRLRAERDGADHIDFASELTGRQDFRAHDLMAAQQARFDERRKSLQAETTVYDQRIGGLNAEIDGYHRQEQAGQRQVALSERELRGLQELADKGYYPKNRLLAMERDIAKLEGDKGSNQANQARALNSITENRMQVLQIRQQFRETVAKDLETAQNHVADLTDQLTTARDQLARMEVVAPVAGAVQNIRVATHGGVVNPGAELMEIVPTDDRLVIEAQVSPGDIEAVEANQTAEVRFSALKGRNTPVVQANVMTVSADHISDPKTGNSYYAARVEVPKDQLARLDGRHIQPGMPVEVLIKGGERTALDYMIKPITDSFATAFKER